MLIAVSLFLHVDPEVMGVWIEPRKTRWLPKRTLLVGLAIDWMFTQALLDPAKLIQHLYAAPISRLRKDQSLGLLIQGIEESNEVIMRHACGDVDFLTRR